MKQLSLFDLFDEEQCLFASEQSQSEKQSTLSSTIPASTIEPAWYKQWKMIKGQYPDAVLLFRVGNFYEAYNEDAVLASRVLQITLTHCGQTQYEMCGFPFHALDEYLPKLVRAGKRVAICDPIEEPLTKNLLK